MYCPACGEPHLSDTERCPSCGCAWRERVVPIAVPVRDEALLAEVKRLVALIEALEVAAVRHGRLTR